MVVSALQVANHFLTLSKDETGQGLTNMQLQKLVYIAQGFTLAILERPLYYEDTRAWQFGPVIPELYEILRRYGRHPVNDYIPCKLIDDLSPGDLKMKVIQAVWNKYKDRSAYDLSRLTHLEGTPWTEVWKTNPFGVISHDRIYKHYADRIKQPQYTAPVC